MTLRVPTPRRPSPLSGALCHGITERHVKRVRARSPAGVSRQSLGITELTSAVGTVSPVSGESLSGVHPLRFNTAASRKRIMMEDKGDCSQQAPRDANSTRRRRRSVTLRVRDPSSLVMRKSAQAQHRCRRSRVLRGQRSNHAPGIGPGVVVQGIAEEPRSLHRGSASVSIGRACAPARRRQNRHRRITRRRRHGREGTCRTRRGGRASPRHGTPRSNVAHYGSTLFDDGHRAHLDLGGRLRPEAGGRRSCPAARPRWMEARAHNPPSRSG